MQKILSHSRQDTNTAAVVKLEISKLIKTLSDFTFTQSLEDIDKTDKLFITLDNGLIVSTLSLTQYRQTDSLLSIPRDIANIVAVNKIHTSLCQLLNEKTNLAFSIKFRNLCLTLGHNCKMRIEYDIDYCHYEIYNLLDKTNFTVKINNK